MDKDWFHKYNVNALHNDFAAAVTDTVDEFLGIPYAAGPEKTRRFKVKKQLVNLFNIVKCTLITFQVVLSFSHYCNFFCVLRDDNLNQSHGRQGLTASK